MKPRTRRPLAVAAAAALALCACSARAIFGVGDTSFVTVIANPAEAANWAAELERLSSQLSAATSTLGVVGDLRAYAGDPRSALAAMGDLASVTGAAGALAGGASTDADLEAAWQSLSAQQKLSGASAILQGAGPGGSMQVFAQEVARDPSLYVGFASDSAAARAIRGQVAAEQSARASVASALTLAWAQFRSATTESGKQAVLTEISQLQSQDQVMGARRRAELDDLELADRQGRLQSGVRSRAADEQELAESSLLNADLQARAQGAESQRAATLQKAPQAPEARDYSGLKLWTTADAGVAPP